MLPSLPLEVRTWDLFCRLLDNFGDVGVNWRLASDLAARGERVRLWVDNLAPLSFMAPQGAPGVQVLQWPADDSGFDWPEPGEVVLETFGCDLPTGFVSAMRARPRPPVWVNVEYLSAEDYAERSHGLPSPQRNGLPKWFFFPGFTPRTAGLLREPGLLQDRTAFDRDTWLASQGIRRQPNERVVLLFCYPNPALPALLQALASQPTLLLLTPGHAQRQVHERAAELPTTLRSADLPWLSQADFDRALWCSDLNCIRGEDTLVRALWAGAPVLWQLYPQDAEVRDDKLAAWLRRLFAQAATGAQDTPDLHTRVLQLHRRYNTLDGLADDTPLQLPPLPAWTAQVQQFRRGLLAQSDLVSQLQAFVKSKS